MSWAAANAPKAPPRPYLGGDDDNVPSTESRRRSTETVEAALSRLSKAYTTSMECIGALHKTNRMLQKEDSSKNSMETLNVLERVATAARSTLETAILLDPLVLPHIPTLHATMQDFGEDHASSRWQSVRERRPAPPVLSSAAHKTTIRELAYLALVNYSDLLQSCCVCGTSPATKSLLDRGVVAKLQTLQDRHHCCWKGESQEDTQRLAVTALCDASKLDGSDPTLWLKLACASRTLENIVQAIKPSTIGRSKHRRLQRYALEQGSQALPPHMPPNRAVQRALQELEEEPEPEYYESIPQDNDPIKLVLDLPRYSWSVLGRMLLRASREGADYHADHHKHHTDAQGIMRPKKSIQFGSPMIEMSLSPMLVLPTRVLGRICLYLDNGSIWRFEATCRALSVAIMSARAVTEEERTIDRNVSGRGEEKEEALGGESQEESNEGPSSSSERGGAEKKADSRKPKATDDTAASKEHHRSSQRLRSQQITSGKKAERSGKRQSFEYCFLAATMGTNMEEHMETITEAKADDKIRRLLPGSDTPRSGSKKRLYLRRQESSEALATKRREAKEPIGDSSLATFVERWSNHNSGPMDLMMRYLIHVAMNAEDVFASDPGGTVVLTSCILSCFEARLKRSGFYEQLVPQFYEPPTKSGNLLRSLEGFALDILHGELILKQCDRYSPDFVIYDDESNMISVMVPNLFEACNDLDGAFQNGQPSSDALKKFSILKIRCHWLIAGFYLWRSRIARVVWEAQEAEEEGIAFIEEAFAGFNAPCLRKVQALPTPHLVSPGRTESHWKEISPASLVKFRDEIQASSVVSQVREKFQDLVAAMVSKIESPETDLQVSEVDAVALGEIGETLFDRYKSMYGDAEAKHSELVEDFLTVHGSDLVARSEEKDQGEIANLIPLDRVDPGVLQKMSQPSILSMLVVCLNMKSSFKYTIAQLFQRLALATKDFQEALMQRVNEARATKIGGEDDDFSDSDGDSMMSDDSDDRNTSNKTMDERRAIQCGHLVAFLVELVSTMFSTYFSGEEQERFIASDDCRLLMRDSLEMSSRWFETTSKHIAPEDTADLLIFRAVSVLAAKISNHVSSAERKALDTPYLECLVKIVISHRQLLDGLVHNHGDRSTRIAKQKICIKRAEYIATVASDVGMLLSHYLGKVSDLVFVPSDILEGGSGHDRATVSSTEGSKNQWNLFIDSILWLWKFASQNTSEVSSVPPTTVVCHSFERPMVKSLRVPVATVVIGLCGAAAASRVRESVPNYPEDPLCLSEFYDSDASANDFAPGDENQGDERRKQKEFLRVACHSVHCIHLVLDKIDDKGALSIVSGLRCAGLGPLLPLVASRVLNHFADELLRNIVDENQEEAGLWSEEYPFSARTVGELLDSNLHKAYRWLYGFVLVGEKNHLQNSGKEMASTLTPIVDLAVVNCRLESVSAAAQLYRCMVRAYGTGRRSPPKKALELVSSALPVLEESEKSKALRSFLFSGTETYFTLDEISRLAQKGDGWDKPFESIRPQLANSGEEEKLSQYPSEEIEDIMRIRRGILSELASGQLPLSTSEATKSKSDQQPDDDRAATAKNEEEIAKKFGAILDDLCLGDVQNTEGWARAAQCINTKAELIADRLGLSKGFARATNFAIPLPQPKSVHGITLEKLEKEQEDEDALINDNWIQCLGNDLSVYTKFSWASFASLREGAEEVGKSCHAKDAAEGKRPSQRVVWKSIQALYRKGDYLGWQEAWGGIFVFALRKLSVRFTAVALYLLQSKAELTSDDKVDISDLCESLGIALYADLMGSQNYGFPMRSMGCKRKRDLASASRVCFQCAVDIVDEPAKGDDDSDDPHATWDLMFMIGKCDEKIAGTFKLEAFPKKQDDPAESRRYEKFVASALSQYATAYAQAKKIEDDGGFIVDQSGGSAHGHTEIFYRILATRLKCLLSAATRAESEFSQAEEEALRLSETNWFKPPEDLEAIKTENIRDRVWRVLADVVSGLAQCRVDQPYFHRSVYRHAQALMWSPILYDPASSEGSLDFVPATRSFQIRGLNNSTPVVQSAEIVMNSLFDKKRTQLAAVWVTTASSSSPFQTLNNSTRKYDSLRGKYIAAYLETLRLSHRRGQLETFLKLTYSVRRDMPGYFQASALVEGGVPGKSHTNDPLLVVRNSLSEHGFLTTVKRQANGAFAEVLAHEMTERSNRTSPGGEQKLAESLLKFAYATYLRLHCSREDLDKVGAWKYGHKKIPEVEALCQAYLGIEDDDDGAGHAGGRAAGKADFGDWSGKARKAAIFDLALAKCRSMFPTLASTFFSKKANASVKSKKGDKEGDGGTKRKEPDDEQEEETTTVSFEVAVPAGVSAGESFFTTVKVGGGTKKLKLTVPATNPSTLRFTLKVPKDSTSSEQPTKKPRTDTDPPASDPE